MADRDDDFELVRGSGNVFADFDAPNTNLRQFRAILAAEIVNTLDSEGLAVRDAEARAGIAAADFSRIRQVKLDRRLAVSQAPMLDVLSLDPYTLFDDGSCPAEVRVCGRHVARSLVITVRGRTAATLNSALSQPSFCVDNGCEKLCSRISDRSGALHLR